MRGAVGVGIRVAIFVFLIWLSWSFIGPILTTFKFEWGFDKLGQWGDSFGALNALFAAIGFAAVIATLWLQQKQNESNEQNQHKQAFDNTFFELLRLLRETRNEVSFGHSLIYKQLKGQSAKETRRGVRAFRSAWDEFIYFYQQSSSNLNTEQIGQFYYATIHKRFESNFGPYFRLIYTILSRIREDNVLNEHEKIRYGNLLRSQLNSYETAMIGFNGLSPVSNDFNEIIEEFRLLKYLPENSRRRSLLKQHYPQHTFDNRSDATAISWYLYAKPYENR